MNRKRNVNYIKPEDPEFLKILKKQAGYDDRNHKFDELPNDEKDFVEDDDSEQPQVVILKKGDLTSEEAELERKRLEKEELEKKADLSQKIVFKSKSSTATDVRRKRKEESKDKSNKEKKRKQLLSFDDGEEDDEES